MNGLLLFLISLFSSTIGAITGIGGGIIVKPTVDALQIVSIPTISFLSGCMVLSMSAVSLYRSRKAKVRLELQKVSYLAAGSVVGGLLGKTAFDLIAKAFQHTNVLGVCQNAVLLALTLTVFAYTLRKYRIRTRNIQNPFGMLLCGLLLGLVSSFLGIGGGPINLLALSYFFSLDSKSAAVHSLFIIFFSQTASLLMTLFSGRVPDFQPPHLVLMIVGGVGGALLGSALLRRISLKGADKVFLCVLGLISVICALNIFMA